MLDTFVPNSPKLVCNASTSILIEQDENFHIFDSQDTFDYSEISGGRVEDWDDSVKPAEGRENCLYFRTDYDDVTTYAYYTNNEWKEYGFDFDITFQYQKTSKMEPKTYKYEIALLGGTLKENPEEGDTIVNVVYKKPILDLTDFIVEGSVSE